MALYSLRLRRALSSLSSAHRCLRCPVPVASAAPARAPLASAGFSPSLVQSRLFRSSPLSLLSSQSRNNIHDADKIDPETILFEGCDFNHWLFTVDFPKDPRPTAEEMVRTYEEICAKGLKISVEEAKKRIYACSTTTYVGFQAVVTEAESEQFRGVDGVVFILPDSYIDPQTKEYGGDKYENGVITPRPPPVQYRSGGGNRNRNFDRSRYDRQGGGGMPNRQGNPQYGFSPPPNYRPQQNSGPPLNFPPQQNQGHMQRDGGNYGPPPNYHAQQQNFPTQQNYGPPAQGRDGYQSPRRESPPPYQGNYNQMEQNANHYNQERKDMSQGDGRSYAAPPVQNNYSGNNLNSSPAGGPVGQNPNGFNNGHVTYGQRDAGTYGQGNTGPYGQGSTGAYGQRSGSYGQGYAQVEPQEYGSGGQTGTDQRRY